MSKAFVTRLWRSSPAGFHPNPGSQINPVRVSGCAIRVGGNRHVSTALRRTGRRRFVRSRRVSFLAAQDGGRASARIVRGTYQSPILVQWQPAVGQERRLEISIVQLS